MALKDMKWEDLHALEEASQLLRNAAQCYSLARGDEHCCELLSMVVQCYTLRRIGNRCNMHTHNGTHLRLAANRGYSMTMDATRICVTLQVATHCVPFRTVDTACRRRL